MSPLERMDHRARIQIATEYRYNYQFARAVAAQLTAVGHIERAAVYREDARASARLIRSLHWVRTGDLESTLRAAAA